MICMEIRLIPKMEIDFGLVLAGLLLVLLLVRVYEAWDCKKAMQKLKSYLVPEYNKLLKDREFNELAFDKDSYIYVRGEIRGMLNRAQEDFQMYEMYEIRMKNKGFTPRAERIKDNLENLLTKFESELPIAEDECKNIFIKRKIFLF